MKIYLICPVRNIAWEAEDAIREQVVHLELLGHTVYYPARDTDQSGWEINICSDNLKAIREADEVYVIWDEKSEGSRFDLGMAFALGKKIRPYIGYFPGITRQKSFTNLVHQLDDVIDYAPAE